MQVNITMLLIKKFRIVPGTGPRSAVMDRGRIIVIGRIVLAELRQY